MENKDIETNSIIEIEIKEITPYILEAQANLTWALWSIEVDSIESLRDFLKSAEIAISNALETL